MHKLLFFSRVALICNVCFVITFLLRSFSFIPDTLVTSTLLVQGIVLSIVINSLMVVLYIMVALAGKPITVYVPGWLVAANFLFFILQAIFLIQ